MTIGQNVKGASATAFAFQSESVSKSNIKVQSGKHKENKITGTFQAHENLTVGGSAAMYRGNLDYSLKLANSGKTLPAKVSYILKKKRFYEHVLTLALTKALLLPFLNVFKVNFSFHKISNRSKQHTTKMQRLRTIPDFISEAITF